MRNSTGSPLFSDFKSDVSRVARFPTAGQRGTKTLCTRVFLAPLVETPFLIFSVKDGSV